MDGQKDRVSLSDFVQNVIEIHNGSDRPSLIHSALVGIFGVIAFTCIHMYGQKESFFARFSSKNVIELHADHIQISSILLVNSGIFELSRSNANGWSEKQTFLCSISSKM
ncbi:hypothetical protein AVEN_150210-1 [Araneus ventricosus]|uniref:Uncharacterized protein n=1 Tax=Araneus ventricosus TaxID=182803 RepID=A0A4Y2U5G5_ARAVE|nr:hypothetical protein AVEN_150210-1 [Araneus ventricosus]